MAKAIVVVNYGELLEGPSPPLRWDGKFLLVQGPDSAYLLLGHHGYHKHHVGILERFCEIGPGPKPSCDIDPVRHRAWFHDDAWEVQGGGAYSIDHETRRLLLGGRSAAFGACDVLSLVDALNSNPPECWDGFAFEIAR